MTAADSTRTLEHYQGLLDAARAEHRAVGAWLQARFQRDLERFGLAEVMRVTNLNDKDPSDVVDELVERLAHVEARLERQDALLAQARAELGQLRADLDMEIHRRKQRVLNLEHGGGRGA